jgi:hypothetical protein
VNWSVSAWAPDGSLVVSLWTHHYRKGVDGSAEYVGSLSRWSGPGNKEARENLANAYADKSTIRLITVRTDDTAYIEAGHDASKVKKEFHVRHDLIGKLIMYNGEDYVFRFVRDHST